MTTYWVCGFWAKSEFELCLFTERFECILNSISTQIGKLKIKKNDEVASNQDPFRRTRTLMMQSVWLRHGPAVLLLVGHGRLDPEVGLLVVLAALALHVVDFNRPVRNPAHRSGVTDRTVKGEELV